MEGPITSRGIHRRLVQAGVAKAAPPSVRDCHPTKKRTRGRLRHFRDSSREVYLRARYENILNIMFCRLA